MPTRGRRATRTGRLTAEGPVTLHEIAAAYVRLEAEWLRRHGHAPDWAMAFAELRPERVFSHAAARYLLASDQLQRGRASCFRQNATATHSGHERRCIGADRTIAMCCGSSSRAVLAGDVAGGLMTTRHALATAYTGHSPSPLSSRIPRGSKSMPLPATRSLTVPLT